MLPGNGGFGRRRFLCRGAGKPHLRGLGVVAATSAIVFQVLGSFTFALSFATGGELKATSPRRILGLWSK